MSPSSLKNPAMGLEGTVVIGNSGTKKTITVSQFPSQLHVFLENGMKHFLKTAIMLHYRKTTSQPNSARLPSNQIRDEQIGATWYPSNLEQLGATWHPSNMVSYLDQITKLIDNGDDVDPANVLTEYHLKNSSTKLE